MIIRTIAASGAACLLALANPVWAGRTVIDGGMVRAVDGYCSRAAAGTADCAPRALGFAITLGGQSYDSFVLHSNGVFALGAPIAYPAASTLAAMAPPVFSPLLNNNSTFVKDANTGQTGDDGAFVADYQLATDSITLRWYPCTTNIFCGAKSYDASFYQGGNLTREEVERRQQANWSYMTLAKLADGFSVTYAYSERLAYVDGDPVPATDPVHYGFDLPGASLEADGPAIRRTFLFDGTGALLATTAVPEPATWATLVAGFGLLGGALRRARRPAGSPSAA